MFCTPEVEETAYHFHRARLSDHADSRFFTRRWKSTEQSVRPFFIPKIVPENVDDGEPRPSFALALLSEGRIFSRVVRRIEDPDLAEVLQMEMAAHRQQSDGCRRLSAR